MSSNKNNQSNKQNRNRSATDQTTHEQESSSQQPFTIRIEKKKCSERIGLYPCDLRNLKSALKHHVQQKLLFKWDNQHEGVILSCKNVKKSSEKAPIHDESPVIFVPCVYRVKVLMLRQSDVFIATVTQTFASHISLQLFGLFNVLIYADDIAPKILRASKNDPANWVDATTEQEIQIGDDIQFDLKNVDVQEFGDFMIIGSIKSAKRNGLLSTIKGKYTVANHAQTLEVVQKGLSKYSSMNA